MKFRIVRNGLNLYAVQFRKLGFWCFWKDYDFTSLTEYDPGTPRYFKSLEEAETAVTLYFTDIAKRKDWRKKANIWEVV